MMLREGFDVVQASREQDPVLRNLFEFYLHDLAEWFRFDQLPDGRYTQSTNQYWREGHDVYFLYAEDIPVGFGLIGPAEEWLPGLEAYDMEEFFVARRHRRTGIGKEFAGSLWQSHPGDWLVRVFQPNQPALPFWRNVISDFTDGSFSEETREKAGHNWSYFRFSVE